jgi:malonyl-CoA O-methyltransferase
MSNSANQVNTHQTPPSIDPGAAMRWQNGLQIHSLQGPDSPWLHDEIGRRMAERLNWLKQQPRSCCLWSPSQGGWADWQRIKSHYPETEFNIIETSGRRMHWAQQRYKVGILEKLQFWRQNQIANPVFQLHNQSIKPVEMLWSNMFLHLNADPMQVIGLWQQALQVGGMLFFSCLGPDSMAELATLYKTLRLPPSGHALTDMHDWGDMMVQAGFKEPVMDMERIKLAYSSPQALLDETRQLGRNFNPDRFPSLRGKHYKQYLLSQIEKNWPSRDQQGRFQLTIEIVYGHAIRPENRIALAADSRIPLSEMRQMLSKTRP